MLRARESVYRLVLAMADATAFVGAYLLAYEARQNLFAAHFSKGMEPFAAYGIVLPYLVVTWVMLLALAGVYEVRLRGLSEFVAILKGTFFGCIALLAGASLYHEFVVSRGFVFFLFPLVIVLTPVSRAVFRKIRRVVFRQTDSIVRLAFIGRNELASRLAAEVKALDVGYRVVGCMTDEQATAGIEVNRDSDAKRTPTAEVAAGNDSKPTEQAVGSQEKPTWSCDKACDTPAPAEGSVDVKTQAVQEPGASDKAAAAVSELPALRLLGDVSELKDIVSSRELDELWIVMPNAPRQRLAAIVDQCLQLRISWRMVPDVYEMMFDWVKLDSVGGVPLLGMRVSNIVGLNALVKRTFDLVFGLVFLAIVAVPMLVISLLIKLTSPGPVLFKQKRIGHKGARFTFLKFRSMSTGTKTASHKAFAKAWIAGEQEGSSQEADGSTVYKMTDDSRVTWIGRLIRKFSLDELPQLINVVRGDMSLVGPRPCLPYELAEYKEWHKLRLEARPGITGLWQISGRNLLSFDEMVKLDIYYVENWSLVMDIKIVLRTFLVVLFGKAY